MAANQLIQITPPPSYLVTTLTYDGKGNNLVEHAGSYRYTHTWDDENRLVKKAYSTVPNPFTMVYRADGKRVEQQRSSRMMRSVDDPSRMPMICGQVTRRNRFL